jgi:hypothetical protein
MSTATSSVAVATDDPRNSNARLPSAGTVLVAQKFFGTAAPGSVAGNLPGDLFTDTTAHNEYVCGAPSGTAAPACTTVSAGGWLQVNGGGGGTGDVVGPASSTAGHLATFADTTGKLIQDGGAIPTGSQFNIQTDVSGSRSNNVAYQNTSSSPIIVAASISTMASAYVFVYNGPSNATANNIGDMTTGGDYRNFSFVVPASWWYKINAIGGWSAAIIIEWSGSGSGGGYSGPTAQSRFVDGSGRAIDGTIYHNTGTTPIWVTASGQCSLGSGDMYAMAASTTPPSSSTDIVGISSTFTSWGSVTFSVLPSWYYSVTPETCSLSHTFWTEWK